LRSCAVDSLGVLGVRGATEVPLALARMVEVLDCYDEGVADLTGLEEFTGLAASSLAFNKISDISPLAAIDNLDWLDVRENPVVFLVIAYAVRRLPYMVRAAVAGLQQTSVTLEEAAANLGANGFTVLRRVTTPLIAANLIAGVLLTFSFSMLEVSDSLLLAQKMDYFPITKTIFELFQLVGVGRFLAAALGVWAMVFLGVTIVGASLLLGKKMGALFRA
jgi:ABC-type Fe3+ transport system permease subunit